jgi:hypothetical protein
VSLQNRCLIADAAKKVLAGESAGVYRGTGWALVGPHWKMADGIDDGITSKNRLEKPGRRDFSNKAGVESPMRSRQSH